MKYIIILIFLVIQFRGFSQSEDLWKVLFTEDSVDCTDPFGFMDLNDSIIVPAKFNNCLTTARYFKDLMAISIHQDSNAYREFHLLKNGTEFGEDSVYIFDMATVCESDGTLKFRDEEIYRVGFFDSTGKVLIPAIYNDASSFINGLSVALIGAELDCCGKIVKRSKDNDYNSCEHCAWIGGKRVLINKKNDVLVENIGYQNELDWYSLDLTNEIGDTTYRDYFKGTNGKYYSFVNYRKEFTKWFYNNFLMIKNIHDLNNCSFFENLSDVSFYSEDSLFKKIQEIRDYPNNLSIFFYEDAYSSNDFFNNTDNLEYFDYCGNYKFWLYPVFTITNTFYLDNGIFHYQDQYTFIRTDTGYELTDVSKSGE